MFEIWRVDDGSTWHFAAPSKESARAQWVAACIGINGYKDEAAALEAFGEPEITGVPLVKAATVHIIDDEKTVPCEHCHGSGRQHTRFSLLDALHEYKEAPEEKRARFGALCNSEWP